MNIEKDSEEFKLAYLTDAKADLRMGRIKLGDVEDATIQIYSKAGKDYVYFDKKRLLIPLATVELHVDADLPEKEVSDLKALYQGNGDSRAIYDHFWYSRTLALFHE
ncbi:hypothetical protein K438DRAFT_1976256 [Mycena galopus ATCC 62051]|nr:hypothetical protein K438DRAFT_1976256 [Mycena galopus ATCC 62051]